MAQIDFRLEPTVIRPSMPICLKSQASDDVGISCDALIDSGAETCTFDSSLCRKLGLKFKKGRPFGIRGLGSGRGLDGFSHRIFYETQLNHPPIQIDAVFIENLDKDSGFLGILGIQGFFDKFSVVVNARDRYSVVELLHASESSV